MKEIEKEEVEDDIEGEESEDSGEGSGDEGEEGSGNRHTLPKLPV